MPKFNSWDEWRAWKDNLQDPINNILAACDQLNCAGFDTAPFDVAREDAENWISSEEPPRDKKPENEIGAALVDDDDPEGNETFEDDDE